jgi:hypothetical protein
MNDSLLSKWLWNIENSNGLWQKIIASKYLKGKPLILVKQRQNDSHFWKKLLSLRDIFYKYCKTDVGNGLKTSFWKSTWLGNQPLSGQLKFCMTWPITKIFLLTKFSLQILNPLLSEEGLWVI